MACEKMRARWPPVRSLTMAKRNSAGSLFRRRCVHENLPSPLPDHQESCVMGRIAKLAVLAGALAGIGAAPVKPGDVAALIKQIRAVGSEGAGNAEAAKAWQQLAASGPESVPLI